MGYAVYRDLQFPSFRWAGYAVPAECDIPDCHEKIDRGMGYRCETSYEEVEVLDKDGEVEDYNEIEVEGCGLHFCGEHLDHSTHGDDVSPKPDLLEWRRWQLSAPSWQEWRDENPVTVKAIISELNGGCSAEEERTLLFSVTEENEIGNSIVLLPGMEVDKYVAAGWQVAETHFPPFGDPRTDELIQMVKDQWDDIQTDDE